MTPKISKDKFTTKVKPQKAFCWKMMYPTWVHLYELEKNKSDRNEGVVAYSSRSPEVQWLEGYSLGGGRVLYLDWVEVTHAHI